MKKTVFRVTEVRGRWGEEEGAARVRRAAEDALAARPRAEQRRGGGGR